MTITSVNLAINLKALALKINSSACGLQQTAIWMAVAPTVTTLPPAPAVVVNSTPRPPESKPVPEGFDYDNPNLCQIFDDLLVEVNDAIYEEEFTPSVLILPYNEISKYYGYLRTYLNLYRYNYSLKPREQEILNTLKVKATSIRLYKFKCEKLSLTTTGTDAKIYPTRFLRAATGNLNLELLPAIISPIKLIGERGPIILTLNEAFISIPGTFSYGWSSTTSTSVGSGSPIGIGYRRNIHQSIYSPSILSANGARPGARFKNLRWYVVSAINPSYSILGMNIRLFHTSATNATNILTPISGESKVVVYSDSSTTEFTKAETVGVLQINFLTNFTWNGVNSIVVESCTSQNQLSYSSQGSLRNIFFGDDVRRHSWVDSSGSSCGDTPLGTFQNQISIQMDFI